MVTWDSEASLVLKVRWVLWASLDLLAPRGRWAPWENLDPGAPKEPVVKWDPKDHRGVQDPEDLLVLRGQQGICLMTQQTTSCQTLAPS